MNVEAERSLERARQEIVRHIVRRTFLGSVAIAVVSLTQVIAAWVLYLTDEVSERVLATVVPISLGLFVVAFLLPYLTSLRLPGLQAQLSGQRESISAGPTGKIDFGSAAPTVGAGPR